MHTLTHTRERERVCCIPTYTHAQLQLDTFLQLDMHAQQHTHERIWTYTIWQLYIPSKSLGSSADSLSFTFQSDARNSRGSMLLFILALSSEIGSHFLMLCSNCWVSNLGRKPTSSPSISKCNRPSCVKISIYQSDWAYMCLCTWVCLCVQVKLYACVFGWVGLGASLEWFGSECTVPPSPPKVICCTGM